MAIFNHHRSSDKYRYLITSPRWRRLRRAYLGQHPLCESCLEKELSVPATEVHHIRPVDASPFEFEKTQRCFDERNLRALCHDCHVEAHKQLKANTREAKRAKHKQMLKEAVGRMFREDPGGGFSKDPAPV